MALQSLGYVGIGASNIDDWERFAKSLLGMQVVEKSRHALALRMDDHAQRLLIDANDGEQHFFGWEVEGPQVLNALASRLDLAKVPFIREPGALASQRGVKELISLRDPAGNRLEVFYGPVLAEQPFKPGRAISGFRTGPLGLGHIVLTVRDMPAVLPFYREVLGFRLSDYMLDPFKAFFLHLNTRHHSLALIETGSNGIHHLMVELFCLDDVGQAYDIALCEEDRVAVTMGRHVNDFMTSFYARTPSPLMIEYGWGGRDIAADWQPCQLLDGASLWGHERYWLSPEKRAQAREMRIAAAARGLRAPVQVLDGNFQRMSGSCPTRGEPIIDDSAA